MVAGFLILATEASAGLLLARLCQLDQRSGVGGYLGTPVAIPT
jgi:hypothetical protein